MWGVRIKSWSRKFEVGIGVYSWGKKYFKVKVGSRIRSWKKVNGGVAVGVQIETVTFTPSATLQLLFITLGKKV